MLKFFDLDFTGNRILFKRLSRRSTRRLSHIHTAEDIFQEVFIKADRNKESFRGESSVKTWLIRITVNACKDYLKSAYNRRVTPLQEFQENVVTLGKAMTSENDFDGIERTVCDYIACMTDKYAIYKFSEIFIPGTILFNYRISIWFLSLLRFSICEALFSYFHLVI